MSLRNWKGDAMMFVQRSRRAMIFTAALLFSVAGALGLSAQPPRVSSSAPIEAVASVGLSVADLDRSVTFFHDVLSFEKVSETRLAGSEFAASQGLSGGSARQARMRLGDEQIELAQFLSPRGRPFPADSRSNDRWFQHIAIIVSDMDRAYAWLNAHRVRNASKGPQRLPDWNKSAAGIRAFYFRDPDGHYLEILEFPSDKGSARWHRKSDRLFLGIDHTAIVVHDTQASLHFYRDALGMSIAGTSENYGPEQAALNDVPAAHLRITTLRAAAGPGIELLEYLSPADGRAMPTDVRAADLLCWQTTLVAANVKLAVAGVREAAGGVISTACNGGSQLREMLVRDPDGHVMKLVAK